MRVVVLDNTDRLSIFWRAGAMVAGADVVIKANSWVDACAQLERIPPGAVDLQVWGRGYPGAPLIAGASADLYALRAALGRRNGSVWWRFGAAHRGRAGHFLAHNASRILGLASVGHCAAISAPSPFWQRQICAVRPGESPWWSPDGAGLRGCSTLRMTVPSFAFHQ